MFFMSLIGRLYMYLSTKGWADSITSSAETGRKISLITVRIGGYRRINARYGYKAYNDVVKQVISFLRQTIPGQKVYRLSTFHYGCVVKGDKETAVNYAQRIEERMAQNIKIRGYNDGIKVPFAILVTECPTYAATVADTETLARFLLDEPDENDTRHIRVVTERDSKKLERRNAVEKVIEDAIREASIEVLYQPILSMKDNKVVGIEALSRLNDDELGTVFPDEFIPMAEDMGVISYLTDCVISRAVGLMTTGGLMDKGVRHMHVNISAAECKIRSVNNRLAKYVADNNLDKDVLCLEISETASPGDKNAVGDGIFRLDELGFGIVLDDYGTGYSNVTGIVALPIALVKLDRSFLWTALKSDKTMQMLKDIVAMIHNMDRMVLVSGVENEECLQVVKDLGIDYVQGFYFCKPVSESELKDYVENVNSYGLSIIADQQ